MPVIYHSDGKNSTVSVLDTSKLRALKLAKAIDIQGYSAGRLHEAPEYLPKYGTYRIAYCIQSLTLTYTEEFRAAYLRALKIVRPPRPEHLRRAQRELQRRKREQGKIGAYLRLAKRATVPHLSRTKHSTT